MLSNKNPKLQNEMSSNTVVTYSSKQAVLYACQFNYVTCFAAMFFFSSVQKSKVIHRAPCFRYHILLRYTSYLRSIIYSLKETQIHMFVVQFWSVYSTLTCSEQPIQHILTIINIVYVFCTVCGCTEGAICFAHGHTTYLNHARPHL